MSAPDPHVLLRMKDAQDGTEPSAAVVTLANLGRLAHVAEDARARKRRACFGRTRKC